MKYILPMTMVLTACAAELPQVAQTVEDIADDTAIEYKISKEALQNKHLDIQINISTDEK